MPTACWIQNNTHTTSKKAFRISPSPAINSPHQLPFTSLLRNHIAFRKKAVFIVDIYINIYKKVKQVFMTVVVSILYSTGRKFLTQLSYVLFEKAVLSLGTLDWVEMVFLIRQNFSRAFFCFVSGDKFKITRIL